MWPRRDHEKPKPPEHAYGVWHEGDWQCRRCLRSITEISSRKLACITDQQVEAARKLSQVVGRLRQRLYG